MARKGFRKLIEACSPEYELVLAGPGRVPGHVPAGVRFLGPVSRLELRELYQASDVFVAPATGEVLTLVTQEAMACGLPVVAAWEPAYAHYDLDLHGLALIAPEPEILRATFLDLLDQPDRLRYMRMYSRRLAEERFDWQINAAELGSRYQAAPASPRVPRGRVRWLAALARIVGGHRSSALPPSRAASAAAWERRCMPSLESSDET